MNIILYQHVCNKVILDSAIQLCEKMGLVPGPLEEILSGDHNQYCVFCDDAHISMKPYLEKPFFYFPVIGRCSALESSSSYYRSDLPSIKESIQSAHFHSLQGNNDGFIPITDIPRSKRLNHSWWHTRFPISNKAIKVFECKNADNWFWSLGNPNITTGQRILENAPLHSLSAPAAYLECKPMMDECSYRDVFVAPFNVINDSVVEGCRLAGIQFVVGKKVFFVSSSLYLDYIVRVSIDRDLTELLTYSTRCRTNNRGGGI